MTTLYVLFGNLLFSLNTLYFSTRVNIVDLILFYDSVGFHWAWNKCLPPPIYRLVSKTVQPHTHVSADSLRYFCGVSSQKWNFWVKNMREFAKLPSSLCQRTPLPRKWEPASSFTKPNLIDLSVSPIWQIKKWFELWNFLFHMLFVFLLWMTRSHLL